MFDSLFTFFELHVLNEGEDSEIINISITILFLLIVPILITQYFDSERLSTVLARRWDLLVDVWSFCLHETAVFLVAWMQLKQRSDLFKDALLFIEPEVLNVSFYLSTIIKEGRGGSNDLTCWVQNDFEYSHIMGVQEVIVDVFA